MITFPLPPVRRFFLSLRLRKETYDKIAPLLEEDPDWGERVVLAAYEEIQKNNPGRRHFDHILKAG